MSDLTPQNYLHIIAELKKKIKQAKTKAVLAVNFELLRVYWEIGSTILTQQKTDGWGTKIIDRLSQDLKFEFPEMKGLSVRNIKYMRAFADAYPDFVIVQQGVAQMQNTENHYVTIGQQAAAQLPWGHHQIILDKLITQSDRLFYIIKCGENHWSRNILVHQIESGLHKRQGALSSNFKNTLPNSQSELTQQLFKDPYNFDFLNIGVEAKERDLEDALMTHVTKFLLELGDGFAFMGRQKRFEAGGQEFFVDLLFYNTKLRRHIIIELKIGEFEAEFVSKMNLYLGLADDTLKGTYDEPAIGLILCKTKNKIVAEYALRDTSKPIGIAEYKIAEMLPENIKGELPSIEEIEQKLDEELEQHQSPVDNRLKTIKEKLKGIKADELHATANYQTLQDIFNDGLKPLYQRLITKLSQTFHEDFLHHTISWTIERKIVHDIQEVENFWKEENNLRANKEIDFNYLMTGFRKDGVGNHQVYLKLWFMWEEFWYGFMLIDDNNYQPFLKKMYHQQLNKEDLQLVEDKVMTRILDGIEQIIPKLNTKD